MPQTILESRNRKRNAIMARTNPHLGSSFESWLEEARIREEVTAAAIKAVIARQLAAEMKKKKITKQRMAQLMKTSRAQVDRLLDPENGSATIESLQRAARIVGRLKKRGRQSRQSSSTGRRPLKRPTCPPSGAALRSFILAEQRLVSPNSSAIEHP